MSLPKAKKEFGQHFLRDQKVISAITTDWVEECDYIVEVGPGPAVLTRELATKGKPYSVIEKDNSFDEYLKEHLSEENIFFTDALKFDWQSFIKEKDLVGKKIWLVSNLPYNVGTVLFTQFLQIPEIHFMTLMFQKEVGDKTYHKPHTPQMNGLFFLSQNYFNSKALLKVLPGSFTPPPKVDSIVVSYERKTNPEVAITDFKKLDQFTRKLFGMKRKQLGKVFKSNFGGTDIDALFSKVGIDKSRRAETLTPDEVLRLVRATFLRNSA